MSAWWLRPWKTCGQLRAANAEQSELIGMQCWTIGQYADEVRKLEDQVRRLLEPSVPEGLMDAPPEFVLVGIDRGGPGKRLMAARDLGPTSFGMTELDDPPPRWKLETVLPDVLIIDKPGYGEALHRVGEIWPGWFWPEGMQ